MPTQFAKAIVREFCQFPAKCQVPSDCECDLYSVDSLQEDGRLQLNLRGVLQQLPQLLLSLLLLPRHHHGEHDGPPGLQLLQHGELGGGGQVGRVEPEAEQEAAPQAEGGKGEGADCAGRGHLDRGLTSGSHIMDIGGSGTFRHKAPSLSAHCPWFFVVGGQIYLSLFVTSLSREKKLFLCCQTKTGPLSWVK